jgi:endonuclease/exonuclease/phosphatase family metal-dependent hydrolase
LRIEFFLLLCFSVSSTALYGSDCRELAPVIRSSLALWPSGSGSGTVTVVTLNLAKETNIKTILADLSPVPQLRGADVLLLQEVEALAEGRESVAERLAAALGFNFVFAPANRWNNNGVEGLAIVSRYPLQNVEVLRLPKFNLKFNNRCRIALAATIPTPLGEIRLLNVHLDSRIQLPERLQQLSPVVETARESGELCLVAGDFNTADLHWLGRWFPMPFRNQDQAVRRVFEQAGFHTPFTNGKPTFDFLGLRLDSVFLRHLDCRESGIEPVGFSDHRALWVTIGKPTGSPRQSAS